MGNENDRSFEFMNAKPSACCETFSLYISSAHKESSDITCSICFTIFSTPRIMKCKHVFCEDCIQQWGKGTHTTCPYCRVELKRNKGTFGRVDKRIQKKIEKTFLKCRNCCWAGSYCQFITTFAIQPYLDEDTLPTETIHVQTQEKEQEQEKTEEKKEIIEVEKTAQKQQPKMEQKDSEQVVQVKGKKNSKGYELFIESLFQLKPEEYFFKEPLSQNYINNPDQDSFDI